MSWTGMSSGASVAYETSSDEDNGKPDILFQISQWVGTLVIEFENQADNHVGDLRRSYLDLCTQGRPKHLHGLPYDGRQPRTGAYFKCHSHRSATAGERSDLTHPLLVGRRHR